MRKSGVYLILIFKGERGKGREGNHYKEEEKITKRAKNNFIPLSTPPPPLAQVVGAAASKCSATTELLAITTTTNIIPQDQFSTFGFFLVLGFQGCSFILVAFLLLCTHLCAAGDFCSPDDQWQPMQWHWCFRVCIM